MNGNIGVLSVEALCKLFGKLRNVQPDRAVGSKDNSFECIICLRNFLSKMFPLRFFHEALDAQPAIVWCVSSLLINNYNCLTT